jgi:hypothetical protein
MVPEKEEGSTRTADTVAESLLDRGVDPILELSGLIPYSV